MLDADRLAGKLRKHGLPCIADIFTDERGVEFLTGAKRRTLRAWRAEKRGPPAVWVNRWLYDLQELAQWIGAQTERQAPARSGKEPASSDMDAAPRSRSNRVTV